MTNLVTRTLSGAVFIAVVVGSALLHPLAYAGVFALFTGWALLEFYQITAMDGAKPSKTLGVAAGVALFAAVFLHRQGCSANYFLALLPLVAAIVISRLYVKADAVFRGLAYTLAGLLYVAVPFALLNMLVFRPLPTVEGYTPALLLGFFILLWTNDTFAYLTGSLLGRHRLFERISPKKSWEGFIGGLVFTLGMAVAVSQLFPLLPWYHWMAIAAIIVVFGVFGDLLESLLKRNMHLKDSGHFLPGHGGILDRFDAALLAAPMVVGYLEILF